MSILKITNQMNFSVTSIPNTFVDNYMSQANGEFVKVYLYLLRLVSGNQDVSVCGIADFLNHTEKDVIRALRYWEQQGLLNLTFSDKKQLINISLLSPISDSLSHENIAATIEKDIRPASRVTNEPAEAVLSSHFKPEKTEYAESQKTSPSEESISVAIHKKHTYSPSELEKFLCKDDIMELLFVAEKYVGKTLSPTDINSILYIYDELGFSGELIEYLIEYCVNNSHKSFRYIEKVAISWVESGIMTLDQAKANTDNYIKTCYPVLKAFGISGRNPGKSEKDFIVKWTTSYGFSMDIIVDACNRTIQNIHQPSFEYADKILSNWNKSGIRSLSDIQKLDTEHKKNTTTPKPQPNTANSFNDFSQRTYDFNALEQKILAK